MVQTFLSKSQTGRSPSLMRNEDFAGSLNRRRSLARAGSAIRDDHVAVDDLDVADAVRQLQFLAIFR
jgi:hypothetical protein